jgi:hypothetical protein
MNDAPDHDPRARLLADVLGEAMSDDFRADLLGDTLRLVRRRRTARRARRAGATLAVLALIGIGAWRLLPTRAAREQGAVVVLSTRNCPRITTELLPASAIVVTGQRERIAVVASTPGAAVVRTTPDLAPRSISDEELLALAAPRHPVLVRTGPDAQELILLSPAQPVN